jgi:predicted Fe-Mo cluster-binding NifX family protein
MSVAHTITDAQAVIVTTPQEISLADVRKSINFCRKINLNVLGIVENMSGYFCPHCGKELPLFRKGGGERTAQAAKVPFLGSLPFDPQVVEAADQGQLMELKEKDSPFLQALAPIVEYIAEILPPGAKKREPGVMKFAVPLEDGKMAAKLANAQHFAIFTVKDGAITHHQIMPRPVHGFGSFPEWLDDLEVTHLLAADLSGKAQELLQRKDIQVLPGDPQKPPEVLVAKYAGVK